MIRQCVISQPTLFPWIGWFDLVDQADILILLDDAAFSKQSWQQRNRIRTPRGLEWVTLPVETAKKLGQPLNECRIANALAVERLLRSIQANYARSPCFPIYFDGLSEVARKGMETGLLVEVNCAIIDWSLRILGIKTPVLRSSALNAAGQRGERVAELCSQVNANCYISTSGASEYLKQDRTFFDRRNIAILMHQYDHPSYRQQFEPFLPFAGIIDLIFNEGTDSLRILRCGRSPSIPLL